MKIKNLMRFTKVAICLFLVFLCSQTQAQLKVSSNNKVGIGNESPESVLQINKTSSSNYKGILFGYYGNDIQGRYGI